LTALPQYEAHAHVIYFDFFLAFFFFVAMTLFSLVCVNLRQVGSVAGLKSRSLGLRLLTEDNNGTGGSEPQSKNENNPYFSVA
jgi:hypothetical protein